MEKNNNMLPIGTLLRGSTYRVTKQLKSGGFGNTYVVENVHFAETYAMKEFFMQGVTTRSGTTVNVSLEDNVKAFTEQKEKFKKEAQRIRKLNHPNIVKIYDLFEDNGTYYYVMDYIDGQSLADRLQSRGAMSEIEAMDVLKKILDALLVVHAAGFTHMDITPRNIMQDKKGNVFLIDFGASKQIASSEQKSLSNTAMPYSPGYAPTEQLDRKFDKIGPWTDFYAIGATLYRILTLQSPPLSSEIVSYVFSHGADPYKFSQDISESTQSLIKWMMHPATESRPQSVDEVKNRLAKSKGNEQLSSKNEETVIDAVVVEENRNKQRDSQPEEEKFQEEPYDKSSVGFFREGLAKVKGLSGRYGYIDQTGKLVIPCRWKDASPFSEGMASVMDETYRWGFIDTKGDVTIPCKWRAAEPFSDGVSKVKDYDNKWLQIDKTGKVLDAKSYISVISTPPARVSIDGKLVGSTPNKFEVEPGRHKVVVENGKDWEPFRSTCYVEKGKTFSLGPTLVKQQTEEASVIPHHFSSESRNTPTKKGAVEVNSTPNHAIVRVDYEYKGTTPLTLLLDEGEHTINVQSTKYEFTQWSFGGVDYKVDIKNDDIKYINTNFEELAKSEYKLKKKSEIEKKEKRKKELRFSIIALLSVFIVFIILISYKACGSGGNDSDEIEQIEEITIPAVVEVLSCPDENHPHAIDLGLPSGTKWACCDIGAKNTVWGNTEGGDYYSWGEILTKSNYYWPTYRLCDGTENKMKWIGSNISGTEYDAASVKLRNGWKIPTVKQFKELLEIYTHDGCGFYDSDYSICLLSFEKGGIIIADSLFSVGEKGHYWLADINNSNKNEAWSFSVSNDSITLGTTSRCLGLRIRPVKY